jgi:virginiamycin B lyase
VLFLATLLAGVTASIGGVGAQPCGSTAAGRFLYVDSYVQGTLARVDPRTNTVVKRIAIGGSPCGMAVGANALWVEDFGRNVIIRVGLKHFKVTNLIRVGTQPWDVAYGFGAVWATNYANGTVSRIDPATRRVQTIEGRRTTSTGSTPRPMPCRRSQWATAASTGAGKVTRIDPKTGDVVGAIDTGGRPFVIRAGFGSVWTGDFGGTTFFRLSP